MKYYCRIAITIVACRAYVTDNSWYNPSQQSACFGITLSGQLLKNQKKVEHPGFIPWMLHLFLLPVSPWVAIR